VRPAVPIEPYDVDDGILEATRLDGETRFDVYVPGEPVVVLGRGSDPDVELHVDACIADGVRVARRPGGGCSVVLDPGNTIVSVAVAEPGLGGIRQIFSRLAAWLVEGLARAGVSGVRTDGVSDLVVGGHKIGGSCIHRSRGLVLFSATILVDPDVGLMERYLAHPPREPAYRRGRSHRDFVAGIGRSAGRRLELTPPPGRTPGCRTRSPCP
jgi:lipoate-protein ligase A